MKIYTKTGDKGETGLFGNKRVQKNNARIEAYGTVDELNSGIGYLISLLTDQTLKTVLQTVQNDLFIIGAELATPLETKLTTPHIEQKNIELLEQHIDTWEAELQPLKNFILPGGSVAGSWCHMTRSIARRCERKVVHLHQTEKVNEYILQYINRLSDFLFVLARYINKQKNISEIPWKNKY